MENHKTITFIIDGINSSGGRERVVSILANKLVEYYNVEIIIFNSKKESYYELNNNIKIVSLYSKKKCNKFIDKILLFHELHTYFVNKNENIFITLSMRYLNLFVGLASLGTRAKIIATEHCDFYNTPTLFRTIKRVMYKKFKIIVTLTEKDRIIYSKFHSQVRCIVNPISFFPSESAALESKIILNVGRLTYQKGHDMLLEAWKKVNKNGWKLKIIGEGEDKYKLITQINKLKLNDSVILCSPTKDIMNEYINASIFILSSRYEGLPMVLLEAMACGLPCISFDCETGPRDLIKNNINGILVDAEDVDSLTSAINKLISNISMIKKYSFQSRLIAKEYSIEKIIDKWIYLIENI